MMLTQEPSASLSSFEYSPEADPVLSFSPMGTVEDFFNFDMLAGGSSSSRSSSRSPSASLWNLPQTPPSTTMDTIPEVREEQSSTSSFFNGLYAEPLKPSSDLFSIFEGPEVSMPVTSAPEVFGLTSSSHSPVTATSPESAVSPSNLFVIDPSLMSSTSTQSPAEIAAPHVSSAEEGDISAHSEDEDDEESVTSTRMPKVGGKGAKRKGTVVSGGVRKTSGNGAVMTQAVRRDDEPIDDDDWRPTPEEYKKMSSKEKRQLRNKISARNFRVRRKEYITTLEGDIAQRDVLIDAIRTELGSTKLENQSLRQEVEALKRALLKGGISPDLPPPGPISQELPASVTKGKPTARQTALLAKANTQKDLPSSARMGKAFWGGAKLGDLGGGVTPVHTTLIPEFAPLIPDKLAARARTPQLQENINPSLNANPFYGIGANTPSQTYTDAQMSKAGFEAFTDLNPFTLKSIDSYRLQLWNRMAIINSQRTLSNNQNSNVLQQQAGNWQPAGLTSQLKPAYFSTPKSSNLLSTVLSTTNSSSPEKENATPTPQTKLTHQAPTAQQAALATLASQSFVQKLGSAFWDAFSSSSATTSKNWDQEKVRKVLEGKAVVRVVDVGPASPKEGVDALEESMRTLAIGGQGGKSPQPSERLALRGEPCFLQNLRAGSSALSGKK